MPYKLFHTIREGKKKFCMTSSDTGKSYCYSSEEARKKGQKMHEAFKHGFKMTKKGK